MSQIRTASTSTKPAKPTARPPSRASSRRKAADHDSDDEIGGFESAPEGFEDELLVQSGSSQSKRTANASRMSALTSLPSETSRRTTRTAASRNTRDVSVAEQRAEENASADEAGKKVSRSKGKTRRATTATKRAKKAVEESAAEEDEVEEAKSQNPPAEVDTNSQEPPVKPKRRGRPPGSGKAKKEQAAAKSKKTPVTVDTTVDEPPADVEAETSADVPEATKPEPKLTRSRSKRNVETESEAEPSKKSTTKSKPRTKPSLAKSTGKSKTRQDPPDTEIQPPPPPTSKSQSNGLQPTDDEEARAQAGPSRASGGTGAKVKVPLSKTKQRPPPMPVSDDEDELDVLSPPVAPVTDHTRPAAAGDSAPSEPPAKTPLERGTKRKSSPTSDEASYTTAQHHMDVDDEPPTRKSKPTPAVSSVPDRTVETQDTAGKRVEKSRVSSQPRHVAPKTRTSTRPVGRVPSRNGIVREAVVDISSSDDEDELLLVPPKSNGKVSNVAKPVKIASPVLAQATAPPTKPASKVSTPIIDLKAATRKAAKSDAHKRTPLQPAPAPAPPPPVVFAPPPPPPTKVRTPTPPPPPSPPRDAPHPDSDVEMQDAHPTLLIDDAPEEPQGELSNATPPPHTPSASPRTPPARPAMLFDDAVAPSSSSSAYTPFLSLVPVQRLTSLTEEESSMTIEEFIGREIELQYQQFKEDGERKIAQFKARAAETRKIIEAA